jgi:uncharacterized protein (DUF697 family)/GTPase SAR1 family protein
MTPDVSTQSLIAQCMKEINSKIRSLRHLNIIVAGKTGVGKSTLINYIFREHLAETGLGRPITEHLQLIEKKDFPLSIYDTRGLELGRQTQNEIKKEVRDRIMAGVRSSDENQVIHCIWYCINTASDRIEDDEVQWIRELTEETEGNVPVIIVLTKAFSKKRAAYFRGYIMNLNLRVCAVVPVLAKDYEIDDDYVVKAYGADSLIQIMGQILPDTLIPTLHNVQLSAIREKVKYARGIVATTATSAFGEGFLPVPFADAAMLVPTQISMIAAITAAFGVKVDRAILSTIITSAIGTSGATVIGRAVSSGILKMIPGVGTVVGGSISGATAAIITTALGETYITVLEMMARGELTEGEMNSDKFRSMVRDTFRSRLRGGK